jgi:hypothetical protein
MRLLNLFHDFNNLIYISSFEFIKFYIDSIKIELF